METLGHWQFPPLDQKKRPLKVNVRRRHSPLTSCSLFLTLLHVDVFLESEPAGLRIFRPDEPNSKVKSMYLLSSSVFCKQITCPRAELLTTYCTKGAVEEIGSLIEEHLAACDFCGAEAQLLTKYPPVGENFAAPEMPESLRSLAEAILCRHTTPTEFSRRIVFEKEGLTLTDA